jgi:hypothetical protein
MIPSAAMSDISGRIYHRLFMAAAISAHTYVITWDCSHWPLHVGGRGVIETCRLLTAAALFSCSYVIRIVFSLPMSSSLVRWISPTAIRKKVARVPLGRGLSHVQNVTSYWSEQFWSLTLCRSRRWLQQHFIKILKSLQIQKILSQKVTWPNHTYKYGQAMFFLKMITTFKNFFEIYNHNQTIFWKIYE